MIDRLPVPLRSELDHIPVFRDVERTPSGQFLSQDRAWNYNNMLYALQKLGDITGFQQRVRPYFLRYGSGSVFDDNSTVSDSLRNIIMQHRDTRTFLKHYRSRRVTIQQKYNSEQPIRDINEQLSRVFSHKVNATLRQRDDHSPEHKRLIETVLSLPAENEAEEYKRRNKAVAAVMCYCRVEEGVP
ncbi:hypothetical protein BDV96DRAFT_608368 [Lophiotrema nucula]|uniref:Uncharacterized protein n=1 Tax=Lophiotrema nucula TaxID=690887 RepID=A0A6A5YE16_9PLEO|nr:hypothetical protein BDV96DRAFT_608368 [Lophiotrema nucula]